MYRAMVGVGLLCGLLIVGVFEVTRPVIARNQAEALERAVFRVLPEARSSRAYRLLDGGGFTVHSEGAAGEPVFHAGYGDAGQLVGVAIKAEGMGYQDVIEVLYGYAFERDAVVGLQVLASRETPGLGDKIEKDPAFLANFEALAVELSADRGSLAHPIEFVKSGQKRHPWQIDGITGATISSEAIARILDRSAARFIPGIRRNLDDFRAAE
jgi:electron transport complex protein RnfG